MKIVDLFLSKSAKKRCRQTPELSLPVSAEAQRKKSSPNISVKIGR